MFSKLLIWIVNLFTSIFGSKRDRQLKDTLPLVEQINDQFERYKATLSDEDIPKITDEFRQRIKDGESLDDLMPEAFGLVKDACRRLIGKRWDVVGQPTVWDMVPYDVQLIGGIVLHQGKIAEMATGEGKTLVAILALYLNSLEGKGVHLITVNDYLAQRDKEWMEGVFNFMGVTIGCIMSNMSPADRRVEYAKDITYGTNNEFGFDYLRDNMSKRVEDIVQREHHYAIVDEVDSVLIDEARTPLIIAGAVQQSTSEQKYREMKPHVDRLVKFQRDDMNKILGEAEKFLESDSDKDYYEAGKTLLKCSRAFPRHKKLVKLLGETGVKNFMNQVEADYLRDKKLHLLDEELLYAIDEKQHTIDLTDKGRDMLGQVEGSGPDMFILPDLSDENHQIDSRDDLDANEKELEKEKLRNTYSERSDKIHTITQLLRAYSLYEKDVEYVVQDQKVMIVDEFTGRLMAGRRYSDGLHQAIEAKENVKIEGETQTVATITLQNYFRLFNKLAGMTGTAETEEGEFWDIYKLEVIVIPTNEPTRRVDHEDIIYRTKREKYNAIIDEIRALHEGGLPVLVGTTSVEVSETLHRMLRRANIKHEILNAKQHKNEAEIIKYAGQPGNVTIATNMAGRGTDIKLGSGVVRWMGEPSDKSQADGGLQILGTERHESRRIDRQLRGRSGRQGDPGASIFFLSLEDDLMRLFGSERITKIMDRLGVKDGEVITHAMISKSIGKAQKRVEGHHFSIRKHLLEYDDVMNQQREIVYARRKAMLYNEDVHGVMEDIVAEYLDNLLDQYSNDQSAPDMWDQEQITMRLLRNLHILPVPEEKWGECSKPDQWHEYLFEQAMNAYSRRKEIYGEDLFARYVRWRGLEVVDEKWRDHLADMDRLKEGVGLRAYGQKDPLIEYKREGFQMFSDMLDATNEETLYITFNEDIHQAVQPRRQPQDQSVKYVHDSAGSAMSAKDGNAAQASGKKQPVINAEPKISRNAPCPCGSGNKYKHCHGKK